jgi:hypothetical protein
MELRSGSLIASGTGFTSAEQARAACLGQARVQLPPAHRPAFEAATRGVMRRWTALRLAVENGWGGDDSDAQALELEQSILGWFYAKGAARTRVRALALLLASGAWRLEAHATASRATSRRQRAASTRALSHAHLRARARACVRVRSCRRPLPG